MLPALDTELVGHVVHVPDVVEMMVRYLLLEQMHEAMPTDPAGDVEDAGQLVQVLVATTRNRLAVHTVCALLPGAAKRTRTSASASAKGGVGMLSPPVNWVCSVRGFRCALLWCMCDSAVRPAVGVTSACIYIGAGQYCLFKKYIFFKPPPACPVW